MGFHIHCKGMFLAFEHITKGVDFDYVAHAVVLVRFECPKRDL